MQAVDVYPTLCELADVEPPSRLAGRSLVPILEDPAAEVQEAVFQVYPRGGGDGGMLGRAVRTERYRYVEWRSWKTGAVVARELYDYETDPEETANLADRPAQAPVVGKLSALIAAQGPARSPVKKNPAVVEPAGANRKGAGVCPGDDCGRSMVHGLGRFLCPRFLCVPAIVGVPGNVALGVRCATSWVTGCQDWWSMIAELTGVLVPSVD